MKNNSYGKEDIVKYIVDSYDEIYRSIVEDYMQEAGKDSDLIYGKKHCPKTCPWNLQDLIRAPYQDLIKIIHDPINDRDAARLIKKCKFIELLHEKALS